MTRTSPAEEWFYLQAGALKGPVSVQELGGLLSRGQITRETAVTKDGRSYRSASDVVAQTRRDPASGPRPSTRRAPLTPPVQRPDRRGLWIALAVCAAILFLALLLWAVWPSPERSQEDYAEAADRAGDRADTPPEPAASGALTSDLSGGGAHASGAGGSSAGAAGGGGQPAGGGEPAGRSGADTGGSGEGGAAAPARERPTLDATQQDLWDAAVRMAKARLRRPEGAQFECTGVDPDLRWIRGDVNTQTASGGQRQIPFTATFDPERGGQIQFDEVER